MKQKQSTVINRPAAHVWRLLGDGFGDAATWASSIDASWSVGEPLLAGAPARGRECHVAVPGADRLVEELEHYDEADMTLTYVVAAGMQRLTRTVRNTWSVAPLDSHRAELTILTSVEFAPAGHLVAPLLMAYLRSMGRRNAADFKEYVETGCPSERKRRQATGRADLSAAATANAGFTVACGAALTLASSWWATQLGRPPQAMLVALGTALLAYATVVAGAAGRGLGERSGRILATLDAAWVVGSIAVLGIFGSGFSAAGVAATAITAVVVGIFGIAQWRAAKAIRSLEIGHAPALERRMPVRSPQR